MGGDRRVYAPSWSLLRVGMDDAGRVGVGRGWEWLLYTLESVGVGEGMRGKKGAKLGEERSASSSATAFVLRCWLVVGGSGEANGSKTGIGEGSLSSVAAVGGTHPVGDVAGRAICWNWRYAWYGHGQRIVQHLQALVGALVP